MVIASDLTPKGLFFNSREEKRMEKESRGGGRSWSGGEADNRKLGSGW
jgi:hypothetical protein